MLSYCFFFFFFLSIQIDNLKMADEVDPVQFQSVLDDLSEVTKPGRNKTDKPPINEVKDVINEVTDIYEKKTETTEREFEVCNILYNFYILLISLRKMRKAHSK